MALWVLFCFVFLLCFHVYISLSWKKPYLLKPRVCSQTVGFHSPCLPSQSTGPLLNYPKHLSYRACDIKLNDQFKDSVIGRELEILEVLFCVIVVCAHSFLGWSCFFKQLLVLCIFTCQTLTVFCYRGMMLFSFCYVLLYKEALAILEWVWKEKVGIWNLSHLSTFFSQVFCFCFSCCKSQGAWIHRQRTPELWKTS